ncbi:hypothetical protein ACGFY9_16590 [Streptomyces sp. NPDC048504]|uniref:hypothetical protein n=1 Tax=Streptomyces sp. NPDC048504 TaxID=3365559 RepID=UPI003713F1D1
MQSTVSSQNSSAPARACAPGADHYASSQRRDAVKVLWEEPVTFSILQSALAQLPRSGKLSVMDIGCGAGEGLRLLRALRATRSLPNLPRITYRGLDLDEDDAQFWHGDIRTDLPESPFDIYDLAQADLEPYPISRAASHINFYRPQEIPIEHHTEGAAMVELIPLYTSGNSDGGATLIHPGPPEEGRWELKRGRALNLDDHARVAQRTGHGVLTQGRRLLHTAEPLDDGERITLVLVMRSAAEPWKDGNSLARLLLDDPIEAVREEWINDQQYQADRYRTAAH